MRGEILAAFVVRCVSWDISTHFPALLKMSDSMWYKSASGLQRSVHGGQANVSKA